MKKYISGAYDLHIHTAPDVTARKCSDRELAKRLLEAGMKGGAVKSHYFETASRAALLREEFPQLNMVGCLVLNLSVGGLNPHAVRRFIQMGGKMLWFPTMDALDFQARKQKDLSQKHLDGLLRICDPSGALLPEVLEILDLAAEASLVIGTGHLSAKEGMQLVREGKKRGVKHLVLTHAEHPALGYRDDDFREAAALGIFIEHSYNNAWFGRCPIEEIARQIRVSGCEHVILTTDFGQPQAPYPDDGLEEYAQKLSQFGFSDEELHLMLCENPKLLIQKH